MCTSEIQREQQSKLHANLWKISNDLRNHMEANEFKNYILGLIFYRYLSEQLETRADKRVKYSITHIFLVYTTINILNCQKI